MDNEINILDVMGHGNRKLRIKQVRRIRELYFEYVWDENGDAWTQKRLASMYGVGQSTISKVLSWELYPEIDPGKAVKMQTKRTNKLKGSRWRKVRRGE